MDLAEELENVRRLCHTKVADSKLVVCTREIIRVKISKSKEKTIVVVLQFPDDYPNHEVLVELRSKTLDDKLLEGLTKISEDEARKYLGEPQVMLVLKFITRFLDENPLCCCSSEISTIKKSILQARDVIKLKQKTSCIHLNTWEGQYYFNCRIEVPHNYPETAVKLEVTDSNFPKAFCRVFLGHAAEIARRCVEPPLSKRRMNSAPFQIQPCVLPVAKFLVHNVHKCPAQKCPVCQQVCFPEDPNDLMHDENHDKHVERILCGCNYHLKCLTEYMKTPPFAGGKKCLVCRELVSHEKYKLTAGQAEARWAHQQARQRELDDVVDFLS